MYTKVYQELAREPHEQHPEEGHQPNHQMKMPQPLPRGQKGQVYHAKGPTQKMVDAQTLRLEDHNHWVDLNTHTGRGLHHLQGHRGLQVGSPRYAIGLVFRAGPTYY